ncbi:hypothetical protein NE237_009202 [Protea cynaroides]|uniref:BHLH domain-containing protein n=1 Tax=Protea cynaroides TaxID=273540 RepID=A0A9Q0KXC3_9MAGN|nr:hypothetical protein NE237_009202 [Protea cynaroides]
MDNQGFRNLSTQHNEDFSYHDCINEGNLGQFIDLVRGQNPQPITNFNQTYDVAAAELMFYGGLIDNQFCSSSTTTPTPQGNLFDFNSINTSDPEYNILNGLPFVSHEDVEFEVEDDEYDEDDSSVTTNNGLGHGSMKADRSKTLVSERRRRGRMKEKLYALRSLVPNITKMDTASIVGDAVEYVKDLQREARNLKEEIAGLRSSLKGEGISQDMGNNPNKAQAGEKKLPVCKKIVQMDVFQEEEKGYYVRLACNKGEGVVVALHKALESLTRFDVQRSNFAVTSERSVMTFKLNVKEPAEEMNMSTLKIWVTGALLNQGFEFKTPVVS